MVAHALILCLVRLHQTLQHSTFLRMLDVCVPPPCTVVPSSGPYITAGHNSQRSIDGAGGHRHQTLPERLNVESDMPNRAKIKETVTKEASIIALILHNSLLIHQKMQYKYISNAVVVMFFVEVCECQFGCILQKNMTVKFVYIHSLEIICGLPTFFFRK